RRGRAGANHFRRGGGAARARAGDRRSGGPAPPGRDSRTRGAARRARGCRARGVRSGAGRGSRSRSRSSPRPARAHGRRGGGRARRWPSSRGHRSPGPRSRSADRPRRRKPRRFAADHLRHHLAACRPDGARAARYRGLPPTQGGAASRDRPARRGACPHERPGRDARADARLRAADRPPRGAGHARSEDGVSWRRSEPSRRHQLDRPGLITFMPSVVRRLGGSTTDVAIVIAAPFVGHLLSPIFAYLLMGFPQVRVVAGTVTLARATFLAGVLVAATPLMLAMTTVITF